MLKFKALFLISAAHQTLVTHSYDVHRVINSWCQHVSKALRIRYTVLVGAVWQLQPKVAQIRVHNNLPTMQTLNLILTLIP